MHQRHDLPVLPRVDRKVQSGDRLLLKPKVIINAKGGHWGLGPLLVTGEHHHHPLRLDPPAHHLHHAQCPDIFQVIQEIPQQDAVKVRRRIIQIPPSLVQGALSTQRLV